ncbi:hypothetical protein NDU88_003829 [Pleurodeles waltl]|uniref:Uncharacterized protein n=1 Tax=Pleurodeles waltl TaxID=8319 RepID=A0AAV7L052_PLEWA|nr:hypothetical protein NDU88_003829 [Pleurodeles waltl]
MLEVDFTSVIVKFGLPRGLWPGGTNKEGVVDEASLGAAPRSESDTPDRWCISPGSNQPRGPRNKLVYEFNYFLQRASRYCVGSGCGPPNTTGGRTQELGKCSLGGPNLSKGERRPHADKREAT